MNQTRFLPKFLLLACTFSIISAFTTVSHAESWELCHGLHVKLHDKILDNYVVVGDPEIIHGSSGGCHVTDDGICGEYMFVQGITYGPEANMTFKNKKTGKVFKIKVQQNFCFLSAGDIHVTPLSGHWEYAIHGGSFYGFDGLVDLFSVTDE
ncbi:MAG: hypothetical protein LPH21_16310 [Shewanella sp.]|nr:hypothetical protein [Shewanella sp.]